MSGQAEFEICGLNNFRSHLTALILMPKYKVSHEKREDECKPERNGGVTEN